MYITHLCAKHNDWVYSHPEEAWHCLLRHRAQGSSLFMARRFCEAIPYLGGAFDIALLLTELEEQADSQLRQELSGLALQLAAAYRKVQALEHSVAVLNRAIGVLSDYDCRVTQARLIVLLQHSLELVAANEAGQAGLERPA